MKRIDLIQIIREELEKSDKNNFKILYLHGLGSTPNKDGVNILKSKYDIVSPQIDYHNQDVWKKTEEIIKENKFDGVIGHSFGGYLAYYISNKNKIPALMFNPAFGDEELNLLSIPKDVKKIAPYVDQVAIVGSEDDVILPKNQKKELEKGNCEIIIEKIGHDIPKEIFQYHIKKFVEEYLPKK